MMELKNSLPSRQNQAMLAILSQINQIQTPPLYIFKINFNSIYLRLILILSFHLRFGITSAFFASDVSHQMPLRISVLSHALLISLPSI